MKINMTKYLLSLLVLSLGAINLSAQNGLVPEFAFREDGVRADLTAQTESFTGELLFGNGAPNDVFNSRTKIFESTVGGFTVSFPVKPARKVNQLDNPWGLTDFIIYTAGASNAFYGVTYFDSPAVVSEEPIKKLNYDRQKNALIDGLDASLISEKELTGGVFDGMEYVLSSGGNTTIMRTFFVQQRLFRLLVVTKGVSGRISGRAERVNRSLADKFFDSFKITSIPPPATVAPQLPDDFGLSVSKGVFYSDFFGMNLDIPKEFSVIDESQFGVLKGLGRIQLEQSTARNQDLVKYSVENTRILFVAIREPLSEPDRAAVFLVAAENNIFPVFDPVRVAESTLIETIEESEEVVIPVTREVIGDTEFAWYEIFNRLDNVRQRMYLANVNNLALEISMIYETENELEIMLRSLRSIRFRK